jgi:hypothetical protein
MTKLTPEQQQAFSAALLDLGNKLADSNATRQDLFVAGCTATFALLPDGQAAQTFWSRIKVALQAVQ